jgi:sugar phosphate isomerase/epimerase
MELQNFQKKNEEIRHAFLKLKAGSPQRLRRRLDLSWSNWGFGMEDLADSARRLQQAGVRFIELHGNRYGADLGYRAGPTRKVLADCGIAVAGVCGMFSPDNELASNHGVVRQAAIDYIRRAGGSGKAAED